MDERERGVLEREVAAHRKRIDELARELRTIEMVIGRMREAPAQMIRHAVLLRVALKGRQASAEIGAERLEAQELRAMKSLMRG